MKEKHITIKTADTKSELEECFRLREEVFIIEQSVPVDMERDEHDATALHFLAPIDAKPVGTARVVLKDNGTVAKIGRVAVRRSTRGIGIGKRLIAAIEETPALEGVDHFILEAQTHALQFYARMGYQAYGEEFMDAGIPHFRMKKRNPSRAEFKTLNNRPARAFSRACSMQKITCKSKGRLRPSPHDDFRLCASLDRCPPGCRDRRKYRSGAG